MNHLGFYKHGNLPHLDKGNALQFVTFGLADAEPSQQQPRFEGLRRRNGDAVFKELDDILDRSSGTCILTDPSLAKLVQTAIQQQNHLSCNVLCWVVMPNHVHFLIQQYEASQLGKIVKDIKGSSARKINELRAESGKVWQRGYFDRAISEMPQLDSTLDYIHENPVKAGLCHNPEDWNFSSARKATLASVYQQLGWD